MRIQKGKELEYLGMDWEFSTKVKFKMSMIPYINEGTKELNDVVKPQQRIIC